MAEGRVANIVYEGVIRLGLSSGQIYVFISAMDGINSYEKDHGKPNTNHNAISHSTIRSQQTWPSQMDEQEKQRT